MRALPSTPIERMRLFLGALAVASTVVTLPVLLTRDEPLGLRLAGAAASLALGAHWAAGTRRGSFPPVAEPLEAALVFVVLWLSHGMSFVTPFGLVFRSFHGGRWLSALRYALWATAIIGADLTRGTATLQGDVGRLVGMCLVPVVTQSLLAALHRVEASERWMRTLVENSSDVVAVLGADLLVRWQSPSIERVLGHAADAVLGTPLLDLVHPDDRGELARAVREARGEPGRRFMLRLRDGDGGHRPLELGVVNRLEDPSLRGYVVTMHDIADREDIERERQAMSEQRLRDEAARAQVGRLRERLEAQRERQELERMLQRARRLESVGQLAGGVAHDFNNLLAAILNTAALVRDDLPADSPLQEELAEIEDVARRGARLVRQLLLFTQRKPSASEVLDLNAVIGGLERLMVRSLGESVRLEMDLEPGLWSVEADVSNLEQVLVNLLVNARDAMDGAGNVGVTTLNVDLPTERALDLDIPSGRYARLTVVDDGPGMDEWTLTHALDPFFTTKEPGRGTGLGLATVLGIASQAGGTVTIDSRPGNGTAVHVYLPASSPVVPVDPRRVGALSPAA